ncbi:unnamed protein product [Didymodactylos carnosus]|uniref:Uncharacterized protein n=1 Tax=Didymodactylos carnosus TaxID=1234261 RepID=A0A816CMB1_9BILA|nr:unnamed protein product [Didymodactylos carnosus]CAF1624497.1 unnamed protein product [Didymodactylos carnosus]CAF4390372.1 unnamed protein product [Didymodactylos carnosus]CAF4517474.1 unnamed protein product [Didymodactylos carnosus]
MMERKEKKSFDRSSLSSPSTSIDYEVLVDKSNNDHNNDVTPNEAQKSSSFLSDDQFVSQIIKVLDLNDDSTESKMLAKQLIVKGRQALPEFEDDIAHDVYKTQINKDGSELLKVLKNYTEQQWQWNTETWLQTCRCGNGS